MHGAVVLSVFSSAFLVLTTLSGTTGDPGIQPRTPLRDGSAVLLIPVQQPFLNLKESDEENHDWKDFQNTLAKKGWKDLHGGGWGKRYKDTDNLKEIKNNLARADGRLVPNFYDLQISKMNRYPPWAKKSWSQLNGGWGKRDMLDSQELYDESAYDNDRNVNLDMEKKDWNNFQGSWGKREQNWGIIGSKRSDRQSKWDRLKGGWGK